MTSASVITHRHQKLAIHGGEPVRTTPFPLRKTMQQEEKNAVLEVMDSDCLSDFIGGPSEHFLGGTKVKAFEQAWSQTMQCRHTISVNSWTTGLMACIGAIGIEPGDEVICPPYTMSATATAILFYGGIPVFADIEPEFFCIDPASVEARITPRTKAIMVVHLFGGTADMTRLKSIAARYQLKIIEDAAQAPGVLYNGTPVGALGDIGGHSLNYHKHIHTGEGGMITTNDDHLARMCQLIRNHGENVAESWGMAGTPNIIGSNYRLTELQAAIGIEQLKRLHGYLQHRERLAAYIGPKLAAYEVLTPPGVRAGATHGYYGYPMRYAAATTGVSRAAFIAAVNAELPEPFIPESTPLAGGYTRPLYLNPVYQRRIALGSKGFPFTASPEASPEYAAGLCPVAESLYDQELLLSYLVREPLTTDDLDDFLRAIDKVMHHLGALRNDK